MKSLEKSGDKVNSIDEHKTSASGIKIALVII